MGVLSKVVSAPATLCVNVSVNARVGGWGVLGT